jgi:hypothetical protein
MNRIKVRDTESNKYFASFEFSSECGENEEFSLCVPSCERKCVEPEGPVPCTLSCSSGCKCKEGHVRDAVMKCIKLSDCSKAFGCTKSNEVLNSCFKGCEKTCQHPEGNGFCGFNGCRTACTCEEGFLKDTSTGECVSRDHCSKTSQHNQDGITFK